VEASLRRDLPIITTPHAKSHLSEKEDGECFSAVYDLDFFDCMMVDVKKTDGDFSKPPVIKVTGMPGKHVPDGVLGTLNDLVKAVCPISKLLGKKTYSHPTGTANKWMDGRAWLYLERKPARRQFQMRLQARPIRLPDRTPLTRRRIYISGDTLMVDQLNEIPERYRGQNIDLMLIHLGGTTIPSPAVPLLMVTMDAKQGLELVRLINPDLTIPIHYEYAVHNF
jgi:hypothetical protein